MFLTNLKKRAKFDNFKVRGFRLCTKLQCGVFSNLQADENEAGIQISVQSPSPKKEAAKPSVTENVENGKCIPPVVFPDQQCPPTTRLIVCRV